MNEQCNLNFFVGMDLDLECDVDLGFEREENIEGDWILSSDTN